MNAPILPVLKPVNSSHLASAGHDRASSTQYVSFRDGSLHAYRGVPASLHQAMMTQSVLGKSVGSFFNARIKGKFESVPIKKPKT